jgi:hypothetical protein
VLSPDEWHDQMYMCLFFSFSLTHMIVVHCSPIGMKARRACIFLLFGWG